ncbi:MAG: redox-sensing transcriptional repressor Rex [Trueperaceae bacterium]|jgi:redox-sensing transcriptional repressor
MPRKIPSVTISRLVGYLRVLTGLEQSGVDYVTSEELGAAARVSAHQVRKDLVHAEASGTRGRGYTVAILRRELSSLLGLTRDWNVAIVGMGRLGQALVDYPYFQNYNFRLRCGFDNDPSKVGRSFGALQVHDTSDLAKYVEELGLDIAFLTVPVNHAQSAADALVNAGIRGILNFTPTVLQVPQDVRVEPIDFVAGLKRLAYYLQPAG